MLGKNFKWQDLNINPNDELAQKVKFYTIFILALGNAIAIFDIYAARKLIEAKEKLSESVLE